MDSGALVPHKAEIRVSVSTTDNTVAADKQETVTNKGKLSVKLQNSVI